MKKFVVTLLVGAFALTACLGSAQGRPAYPNIMGEYYKDNEAIVTKSKPSTTDRCMLCHDPESKSKKDHNVYGKSFKKHMPKDEFDKLKGLDQKADLAKKVGEALKAAEADKHSSGKTYGEVIKAGKLPSEK